MTAATDSPPPLSPEEREALEAVAAADVPLSPFATAALEAVDEQSHDREG